MGTITFEVECEVEGTISAGDPRVGIFGPQVDDVDLSSVSMLVSNRKPFGKTVWRNADLLDGLDTKSRDIVIANILSAFHDDAVEAVLEDAE